MGYELRIAWRYFFSGKKKNFIHVISWLSIVSVAFCTAALIVVLSVFNGFDRLLHRLYASFDPELKVTARRGKSFHATPAFMAKIKHTLGVEVVTEVIEEYVYLRYRGAGTVVTLKGMSDNFLAQKRLDRYMIQGELALQKEGMPRAVIGQGVRHMLSADPTDAMHPLQVFYIKSLKPSLMNPASMYTRRNIRIGGVFSVEKNHDENYIFVPLAFAQRLLGKSDKRTALEIKVLPYENVGAVQARLRQTLGARFRVLNQEEQQADLYRLLKVEKLFTFFSLSLLILIGSINTFFSLMMLTLDKKKDLAVLVVMGARPRALRTIFLLEGGIISLLGAGAGLLLGAALCGMQKKYGLVGLGIENAVVEHYPVEMIGTDFIAIGGIMAMVTLVVSYYPAFRASRAYSAQAL